MSILGIFSKKLKTKVATIAGLALLVGAFTAPVSAAAVEFTTILCTTGNVAIDGAVATRINTCSGSVVFPSEVTSIEQDAFFGNATLTSVSMPGVTTIGTLAFSNNTSLTSVAMPSVTNIGPGAFLGATGLTTLSMPSTLRAVGSGAFRSATSLASITFAGNAPSVGTEAFLGVTATAYITESATGFGTASTWNGLTLALQPNAAGNGQVPCSLSGSVTVVNHVATNGWRCSGSVVFPSEVTSIGAIAFDGNIALTSVSMPGVTTIGAWAFRNASALTSLSMPLVTTIGSYAFTGTSLISVEMPRVTTVGTGAFYLDTALTSVSMPQVVTIGNEAFSGTRLTSVTLPSSLRTIEAAAFFRLTSLVSVTFAGDAPSVGSWAFFEVTATAYISYPATGFGTETTWQGLLISRAAAPYVEPTVVAVVAAVPSITVTGITGEGGSRTITGTLLSSVTSVVVQGSPVSFSAQSDNSMSFAVPNLPAGRYDILIGGTSGNLIWQEGLVLKAAPILAKISNLNIEGFKARSAKLTTPMKATIKRVVAGFGAKSLTCAPGASSSKLGTSQQKLAIARAKAVCSYATSLAPKAKSTINPRVFKRAGAKDSFVRISLIG